MKNVIFKHSSRFNKIVKILFLLLFSLSALSANAEVSTIARITNRDHHLLRLNYDNKTNIHFFDYNGHTLEIYDWEGAHWNMLSRKYNTSKSNIYHMVKFYCIDENMNKHYVKIYKLNNNIIHYIIFNEEDVIE